MKFSSGFIKPFIKLVLNLSILAGLVLLIRYGYELFTTPQEDPLRGSIYLILGFVAWVVVIRLSRSGSRHYWLRYRSTKPSFKLTTFSVVAILLVLAFASVQPFAGYKDDVVSNWDAYQTERRAEVEVRRVAEESREAAENKEMSAVGVSDEWSFYEEYVSLFNEYRTESDVSPLVFDVELNMLAARRAVEISEPGGFSHEGIMCYNFGENIAMVTYFSSSPKSLVEQWASSPGHRSNMLSSSYYRTGFAKRGRYAVQIFD